MSEIPTVKEDYTPSNNIDPECLPQSIVQSLIEAECALADIAEGEVGVDEESSSADLLQWAENRAGEALIRLRASMRHYRVVTSEWP